MENLQLADRASVASQFARYALAVNYDLLPAEVIHAAKRSLLDTIGCAIGALGAPGFDAVEQLAMQSGVAEATIWGTGRKCSVSGATLANSFLVRFLDYNDCGGGGHNSDAIPVIAAVAQKQRSTGKEFLTAVVLTYELGSRFGSGALLPFYAQDFLMDVRGGISLPPAIGKLMGLNEEQIANAIGVCASHSIPLGILDTNKEANYNAKNLRFGFVARDAYDACILASNGFTGPIRVIEGEHGVCQVILKNQYDLNKMTDFCEWKMLDVRYKDMCCNANSMGHLMATLKNVTENDIDYHDIASVKITTGMHESRHTTSVPKRFPVNAETADHSAYYVNAIAIKNRKFDSDAMEAKHFDDPDVLELINRMRVVGDPELPEFGCVGISEITMNDGTKYTARVDQPHGFGNDPHTDAELEQKFRAMAQKHFDDMEIERIIKTIWNIDQLETIDPLMSLLTACR